MGTIHISQSKILTVASPGTQEGLIEHFDSHRWLLSIWNFLLATPITLMVEHGAAQERETVAAVT